VTCGILVRQYPDLVRMYAEPDSVWGRESLYERDMQLVSPKPQTHAAPTGVDSRDSAGEDIDHAKEFGHLFVGRCSHDIIFAANLFYLAFNQDRSTFAEGECLVKSVRYMNDCRTEPGVHESHLHPKLTPQPCVQRPIRLIEQQKLWSGHQGPRQGHTLLLAAAETSRLSLENVTYPQKANNLAEAGQGTLIRPASQTQRE
jgi:hypothetical protein